MLKKLILTLFLLCLAIGMVCLVFLKGTALFNKKENSNNSSREEVSVKPGNGSHNSSDTLTQIGTTGPIAQTEEATVTFRDDVEISELADRLLPSMVSIDTTIITTNIWGYNSESHAQGSGVIYEVNSSSLCIVTNHHVIEDASAVEVTLADGTTHAVTVQGSDLAADLAILDLPLNELTSETIDKIAATPLANTASVTPGEMVIAIGNALGKGTSVTVGYVSAINREITTSSGVLMKLIQTDAAINPGNSGGALINLKGELIGINSSKLSAIAVEGMGFAIPASAAVPIIAELSSLTDVPEGEQGYLGVRISTVTSAMAKEYDMPIGVCIEEILNGGAAERASLLRGDIITGVNGIAIVNTEQLSTRITAYRRGTTIQLTVQRRIEGEYTEITVPVTLIGKEEMDEISK